MRISIHEQKILNAVADCYPVKSSFAKLVKETGKARNEIEEIVGGLKRIGYVNITTANEIYLIDDGRKYLGIGSAVKTKPVNELPSKAVSHFQQRISKDKAAEPAESKLPSKTTEQAQETKPAHGVLLSIDELARKLNKPVVEIADCDLKGQALAKLADLMADDIAALLLEIKGDLERAAA